MASLLEKHGVCVLTSLISPYRETRDQVRPLCQNFVEVYVSTSLEACERRDVKGLYKKARAGEIEKFTGIDDVYEEPLHPEITVDTEQHTVQQSVEVVMAYLRTNLGWC